MAAQIWREQDFSIVGGSSHSYDAISRASGKRVTTMSLPRSVARRPSPQIEDIRHG